MVPGFGGVYFGRTGQRRAQWQAIGPAPPGIEASIAVDRASDTVYIGSLGGGVFKSIDGGQTFLPLRDAVGARPGPRDCEVAGQRVLPGPKV